MKSLNAHIIKNSKHLKLISKLLIFLLIACLHIFCYYQVNQISGKLSPSGLYNFETGIDKLIPYLSWTWIFYYAGEFYILVWASIIVLLMPDEKFKRTVVSYILMILTGAYIQILFPAQSPYPPVLTLVQKWFHTSVINAPYACLPSMHVALCIFPALIGMSVLKSHTVKYFSLFSAVLISISTLTLKEHYFLDVIAGFVLGLIFYFFWKINLKKYTLYHNINFKK